MKVLFVINSMNMGGAERLLVESIPFFQSQNVKVDVLVLSDGASLPLWKELKTKCNGRTWSLTNKSIYNPLLIFDLIKVFKSYSLVHIHLFPALYWCVLAKLFSGNKIRLYYTEHSTHNKRRKKWYFRIADRFIYSNLEKIIAISGEVQRKLISHLGEKFEPKILLVPNGIDIARFRYADPYPKGTFFEADSIILTQVSSFRYPKDQKTLLKALKLLDKRIKLLLVGTGDNIADCKLFCSQTGLTNRVHFLGIRDDVPRILQSSDILILSSAYEGLSLSNIEGMSVGKPFVASNVPGIKEIVDGYGLLFEYQDYKTLADIIKSLCINIGYYNEVGKKCLERSDNFDINSMVLGYIRTYETI